MLTRGSGEELSGNRDAVIRGYSKVTHVHKVGENIRSARQRASQGKGICVLGTIWHTHLVENSVHFLAFAVTVGIDVIKLPLPVVRTHT